MVIFGQNETKAFYWLEKAMKAGHIGAGVQVAKILMNGWGQEKDEKKGTSILEGYAGTTNANAHFELGKIYYYGFVKVQDYKKALYHFKLAAEREHASSQNISVIFIIMVLESLSIIRKPESGMNFPRDKEIWGLL